METQPKPDRHVRFEEPEGAGCLVWFLLIVPLFYCSCTIADAAFVCVRYGTHAYFRDGLRVADWKHGVMSTGERIPIWWDLPRGISGFLLGVVFIVIASVVIRRVQRWCSDHRRST